MDTAQRTVSLTRFILPGVLASAVVFLVAVMFTGIARPAELADPGAFVRWSLPIARAIHHSSMSVAIAALVFAAAIVPRSTKTTRDLKGTEHPAFSRSMNIAAGSAVLWTLSAATVMVLTFWDLAGLPMSLDAQYSAAILDYVLSITTGRAWAWMVVIAAIVSSLALAVRSKTGVGAAALFSQRVFDWLDATLTS